MQSLFVPQLIYENVLLMMKNYRYLEPITPILPEDKFRKDIQYGGVVNIKAKDSDGHRPREETITYISIMGIDSKFIKATADFKRHINNLIGKEKDKKIDIIIISYNEPSIHINKKIAELTTSKMRIFTYNYDVFKAEIPKHKHNGIHELLNGEEVEYILDSLMTEPHHLPKLRAHKDATAIWYGFEPGDIVRVRTISEISGEKIIYKQVI